MYFFILFKKVKISLEVAINFKNLMFIKLNITNFHFCRMVGKEGVVNIFIELWV